ncbi:hypothetical protein KCV00_g8917, partial [Aureobasidium melanogenum]
MRAFCAITAHFCDAKGEFRTLLLSLPHQAGHHTGFNIASTISAIVQTFGLEQKLGWFVCDDASNNDTCIEALGSELEFDRFERLKLRTLPTLTSPLQHQLASHNEHGLLNERLNYPSLLLLLLLLLLHFLPLYRKPYQQLMTSSVLRSIMGG